MKAILIGGHRDGQELDIPNPMPVIRTPSVNLIGFLQDPDVSPEATIDTVDYHLLYYEGSPSIDDKGRYQYGLYRLSPRFPR